MKFRSMTDNISNFQEKNTETTENHLKNRVYLFFQRDPNHPCCCEGGGVGVALLLAGPAE